MAVDSRFDEVSEFLADLLVDPHPSSSSSHPYPNLSENITVDDLLIDQSAQNVNFSSKGISSGDFDGIPPISGDLGGKFFLRPTSNGTDEVSSNPQMSSNHWLSPGGESSSSSDDNGESSDAILKYINQLLMEEDMEGKPWFFGDEVALQNTEKSLYDVLGEKYPRLPGQNLESDDSCLREGSSGTLFGSTSDLGNIGDAGTSMSSSNSVDPNFVHSPGEFLDHALLNTSYFGNKIIQQSTDAIPNSPGGIRNSGDDLAHPDATEVLAKNIFSDSDSVLQFRKGLEEASKFLPSSAQLFRNLDNSNSVPEIQNEIAVSHAYGSKGLKSHVRDDAWVEEGRASKQSAIAGDEGELSEMFDKVLLEHAYSDENSLGISKNLQPLGKTRISKGGKVRVKKQTSKSTVDLRALLLLCAQAVNVHDLRTANELLKQIRENSSPRGDGSERLAHYFANGLEARIAGSEGHAGSFFTSTTFKKTSAADLLKAYHDFLTACPFMKFPIMFSGYMISKLAANVKVLHIIDFGIAFGFHWPIVIQKLSERPMGPPKLRITGIEFPVPGFRPAQRTEEAGRRLARYCKRFGVTFEYNAVASQEWGSIKIEDLKIRRDEMVAVNCFLRFKNLIDDMGEEDSPRDAVLDLIMRIKPDIFVHNTPNGSYNSPFFLTRFREALFHLSAEFDMLDVTLGGADTNERQTIEWEFYGRGILNVIAAEGLDRIERPETYKQWQVRHLRAGFKQLPLDQELMTKLKSKLHKWYHKDFAVDEDNNWMLLGWRGRIMHVSSCWVPP